MALRQTIGNDRDTMPDAEAVLIARRASILDVLGGMRGQWLTEETIIAELGFHGADRDVRAMWRAEIRHLELTGMIERRISDTWIVYRMPA